MHCNSPFNFSLIFYYKVEIYLRRFHPIIDIRLGWFFCCICALLPKDSVFAQTYFHAYNRKKKKTNKEKKERDWPRSTQPEEANAVWEKWCFPLDALPQVEYTALMKKGGEEKGKGTSFLLWIHYNSKQRDRKIWHSKTSRIFWDSCAVR